MLEGTIGTTLPSQLRLATDTISLETWGGRGRNLGLVSLAATSGRSRCSKPMLMLISQHKEVKGVGVNFRSRLPQVRLLDGHLPLKPFGNPSGPLTTLTTHPLRFPTSFCWNQNIPQETKLGVVYDFLFLTQKHLTRF